jgi:hypothetical protein
LALVSSTVSCRSAAQRVAVSRRKPAQMRATPSGWVMKSSPDFRSCPAWLSQAKAKARSISWRSIGSAASDLCS